MVHEVSCRLVYSCVYTADVKFNQVRWPLLSVFM